VALLYKHYRSNWKLYTTLHTSSYCSEHCFIACQWLRHKKYWKL